MARYNILIFTVFLTFVSSFAQASTFYNTELKADKEFLDKQKRIYQLLWHVGQANVVNSQLYEQGKAFKFEDHMSSFQKSPVTLSKNDIWKKKKISIFIVLNNRRLLTISWANTRTDFFRRARCSQSTIRSCWMKQIPCSSCSTMQRTSRPSTKQQFGQEPTWTRDNSR